MRIWSRSAILVWYAYSLIRFASCIFTQHAQALQHILTTRMHQEEVDLVDAHEFLEHGASSLLLYHCDDAESAMQLYDRRIGILLLQTLHSLLDSNRVVFYPVRARDSVVCLH